MLLEKLGAGLEAVARLQVRHRIREIGSAREDLHQQLTEHSAARDAAQERLHAAEHAAVERKLAVLGAEEAERQRQEILSKREAANAVTAQKKHHAKVMRLHRTLSTIHDQESSLSEQQTDKRRELARLQTDKREHREALQRQLERSIDAAATAEREQAEAALMREVARQEEELLRLRTRASGSSSGAAAATDVPDLGEGPIDDAKGAHAEYGGYANRGSGEAVGEEGSEVRAPPLCCGCRNGPQLHAPFFASRFGTDTELWVGRFRGGGA